jgi:Tfp pilus assembly protein PilX
MRGDTMKHGIRNEEGSAIVVAFVLLVVLTLIGVLSTRTATVDIRAASNQIPYQQNFYIAEGGVHREAAEVARGSYPISNVLVAQTLATETTGALPAPDHKVAGNAYAFQVDYLGYFSPPAAM